MSSDEDEPLASNHLGHENAEDEGTFVFKRHKPCTYQKVSGLQRIGGAAVVGICFATVLTQSFAFFLASHKRVWQLAMDIEIREWSGRS